MQNYDVSHFFGMYKVPYFERPLAKNEHFFFRDIDDIVLSYVVSILQDLTSGSYMDEEAFDVDAFCETIFAYMPATGKCRHFECEIPVPKWSGQGNAISKL